MTKSITWYCGKSWEPWSPKSLETGISGSQAAVINLSRQWAKLGHKVRVYNSCAGQEGFYDGVEYTPFEKFDKFEEFDVIIIWRERNLSSLDMQLKAGKIILELQDIPYRTSQFTQERLKKIDMFVVKSRFHYQQFMRGTWFSRKYKRKFAILPNGIDADFLGLDEQAGQRNPFRLIYASNYNRGLEQMLKYGWPIIKEKIPQARLDIYYGWGQLDSYRKDEKSLRWKEELIGLMGQTGVRDCGRIGLAELMSEKAKSALHYYGCTWPETDCISVRESALAGCVPVTTTAGALAEKPYCIKVKGSLWEKKTQEKLAYKVIELLKNPRQLEKIRSRFRALAGRETWDAISRKWLKLFV